MLDNLTADQRQRLVARVAYIKSNPLWVLDVHPEPPPFVRCDLPRTATVEQLITFCASMPDRALRVDFGECVLDEARDEVEREQLRLYHQVRTRHPSFKPGSWTANNHRAVVAAWREVAGRVAAEATARARAADLQALPTRQCEQCGHDLPKGSRAVTCGARCRKARSRSRPV